MSFRVLDALPILVLRFGETVNKVQDNRNGRLGLENKNKVMGFHTPGGRAIGLDVYPGNMERARLWLEPPAPPSFPDVTLLPPKKCADLKRHELAPLSDGKGIYLQVEGRDALWALLDWYA